MLIIILENRYELALSEKLEHILSPLTQKLKKTVKP